MLLLCLAAGLTIGAYAADAPLRMMERAGQARIVPELEAILAEAGPDEFVDVVVETRVQADLAGLPPHTGYDEKIDYLQYTAREAQREILAWLETTDARNVRSSWLVSSVALSATPGVVRALAAREDVAFVSDDFIVTLDTRPVPALATATSGEPDLLNEWGILRVKAPECWAAGFNGAGIVVGNIDSGVEAGHPAFGGRWRSTNGWFDGVNGQPNPYDDNGHGTHCMGSAVGGNGIGVAPGATFIAAKGLDRQGSGNASTLDGCLDWMAGTGRPDVLSNSWGGGRTTTYFFNRFVNLRNLGMVVIAAIGNDGPNPSTSATPGSFPINISVGATNISDAIAYFSSRGPAPDMAPWNDQQYWSRSDWNLYNPVIAAPGENIRSAIPGGGYYNLDGTSMACPHVAGGAAILLQKKSDLTHNQIYNLFLTHADQPSGGGPYPNNNFGWGILNVKAALDNVGGGGGQEETLKVHHTHGDNAVGLTSGGIFYAAARLTPTRDCDVVAGIFLQYQASQDQQFFVWRGNTATNPGAVVEQIPYPGAGTGWKRANLAQSFRVSANQDFWLGPRFQHAAGEFPGAVDDGPPVPQRGGWISMDGTDWDELRDFGLDVNWMVGAIVRYGGGVEEELLLPVGVEPRLRAPAITRGPGRVAYTVPVPGRVELSVYDTGGRLVRTLVSGPGAAGEHSVTWDRQDNRGRRVASGAYLFRLSIDGRAHSARSVLLD